MEVQWVALIVFFAFSGGLIHGFFLGKEHQEFHDWFKTSVNFVMRLVVLPLIPLAIIGMLVLKLTDKVSED